LAGPLSHSPLAKSGGNGQSYTGRQIRLANAFWHAAAASAGSRGKIGVKHEEDGTGVIRTLTFTTLYPNAAQPHHGVFVENRLRHLLGTGDVLTRVVAPIPWFPFRGRMFGRYSDAASVTDVELRNSIEVHHPRYLVIPKVGMSVAPTSMYYATLGPIKRLLEQENCDIIDAHYFYPDGVAAIMLGHALNIPVVVTARGTDINLIPDHLVPRRQIQSAARKAAGIVAVSQALANGLVALGVPSERITVLRNGVDLDTFRPQNRELARKAMGISGPTLLSVGHLIERKGHDIAISALPALSDYSLLVAGDGPDRSRLGALAARLGVSERVRFLGIVRHEHLRQVYEAADALVLASSREGWPNVLLESMACGTPVVASAIWGNPEVVCRPEAGVLMEARTPEGVVEGVERLFRRLPSRAATRAFAEGYSWHDTSAGQLRLFRQILARKARGSVTKD
jgi:teichuronic acid biosynthesis glycosyltransferase TuaC